MIQLYDLIDGPRMIQRVPQSSERNEIGQQQNGEYRNRRTEIRVRPLQPLARLADGRVAEMNDAATPQDVKRSGATEEGAERPGGDTLQEDEARFRRHRLNLAAGRAGSTGCFEHQLDFLK